MAICKLIGINKDNNVLTIIGTSQDANTLRAELSANRWQTAHLLYPDHDSLRVAVDAPSAAVDRRGGDVAHEPGHVFQWIADEHADLVRDQLDGRPSAKFGEHRVARSAGGIPEVFKPSAAPGLRERAGERTLGVNFLAFTFRKCVYPP